MTNNYDFRHGAWAMVQYIYDTSGVKFAREVFGDDAHPSYIDEKAAAWGQSPVRAMGMLDNAHRAKLLSIVQQQCDEATP